MQTRQSNVDTWTMRMVLEMWLFMKVQTFLHAQGLSVPQEVDLGNVWSALDVGCGSGQWVRDMATWHPEMTLVGLDRDEEVIEQAKMLSETWQLCNTCFVIGNMHDMGEIDDNNFDLVHARLLGPLVAPRQWPALLHEWLRVCRPGGVLVWTEAAFPTTNSNVCGQWWEWMARAITARGGTADVTPYMERLCRDVKSGCVRKVETRLDASAGAPLHERLYRHMPTLLHVTRPLLASGIASEAEVDDVCQRMVLDLYSNLFQATWTLTTLIVEKSEE